ncbi:hypothetical protein LTS10_005008 [Elasticomyces elasticus]|nr:hypothetical protein LTS10_005008 [Elasticomyces elasticus]
MGGGGFMGAGGSNNAARGVNNKEVLQANTTYALGLQTRAATDSLADRVAAIKRGATVTKRRLVSLMQDGAMPERFLSNATPNRGFNRFAWQYGYAEPPLINPLFRPQQRLQTQGSKITILNSGLPALRDTHVIRAFAFADQGYRDSMPPLLNFFRHTADATAAQQPTVEWWKT